MTKLNKLLTISLLAVLLLAVALPFSAVFAETSTEGFDDASIYDDLKDASILGKTFDINDYPVNENGTPELLAFVEFAFSLKHEYQLYYGLYIYVYYPQGNLVVNSELNNIEMANKYEGDEVINWSKYTLKFLDKDYNGVLYKFKVMNSHELEHTIAETYGRVAMSSAKRRYDIHSIELHEEGNESAVNYGIGGTWTITGYGKGLHDSSAEQSTLQSVATFQNTLKLDVHSTYYRGWLNYANTLADQLSSVYFAVDNNIDKEYDRLYALKFEAFKYLTSPIFCVYEKAEFGTSLLVNYQKTYENLLRQRGLSKEEIASMYGDAYLNSTDYTWMSWCSEEFTYGKNFSTATAELERLAWVFQTKSQYDHKIGSSELMDYMSKFSSEYKKDVRDKYSSLLFADYYYSAELNYKAVENGKNIGRTITADEEWELRGSLSKNTLWKTLKLLFNHVEVEPTEFYPIQAVNYADIEALTNEEISEKYLISISDVSTFSAYVKEQNSINKTVYLFRYDIDTFYTTALNCQNIGVCGYVAQEPIYLDFDIISLTYDKAGVQTVIPVVSNPIDAIAGIEPPTTDLFPDVNIDIVNLYSLLIIVLAAVFVVPLVLGALKFIFNIR